MLPSCPKAGKGITMTDNQAEKPKNDVVKALMKVLNDQRWKSRSKLLGLTDEAMSERLIRLLLIHLVMDRTVTGALATKLAKGKENDPAFEKLEGELSRVNLSSRIRLAEASGLISHSGAKGMHELNDVRNKFSHYDPKLQGGLGGVKEIASEKDFEKLIAKALVAVEEIGTNLGILNTK
jgi:hypothetical protein